MKSHQPTDVPPNSDGRSYGIAALEISALLALFFIYAGDPAPAVNEAHYLVKAKNYWDPAYCAGDLFASSGKAQTTFYWTLGWLTQFVSLGTTAWVGRVIGWLMIAIGLRQCCRQLGLPAFHSLGVAVIWLVGIQYGNLAGEWVVGGIEAKVPAYAMVLLGLSEIIRRNWSRGWIWLGGASAFHVLTGGWAVVAAMITFLITERWNCHGDKSRVRFFSVGLFVGGGLALLGLLPALRLTLDASPEDSVTAARIYSYYRISHHLLPGTFPIQWFVRHGVLAASLVGVLWFAHPSSDKRRMLWFGFAALLIAVCGLVVGVLPAYSPDLAAKLLRYYWFRLSDAMVPLALAFWLMGLLLMERSEGSLAQKRMSLPGRLASTVLLIAIGLFGWSCYQRNQLGVPPSVSHRLLGFHGNDSIQEQRRAYADWVAVCDWVRVATPKDEIFLTPRHQQTFKWYSSRAEVVNWKDVPQDAASLLEWNRRFDHVYPRLVGAIGIGGMRVPISYAKLREYRQQYGVRLMVVDNRITGKRLPLVKIYPIAGQSNQTYSIYELPND